MKRKEPRRSAWLARLLAPQATGVLAALAAVAAAPVATVHAQSADPCNSCATCTELLSRDGARVELVDDIATDKAGACIVIRGRGAVFDGLERDVRPVAPGGRVTAVRVEADEVVVKNLHVVGADVGIDVQGARRVVLFHDYLQVTKNGTGVRAVRAGRLRVTRTVVRNGAVGISLGADDEGKCPKDAELDSPGVVLNRVFVDGAGVGIAACTAFPVVRFSKVLRGQVGVRIGVARAPKGSRLAPDDECLCAPAYADVHPGTALFFSSGCHGCQIHEAWVPDLRKAGRDILVRPTGPENRQASAEFDAYCAQCYPQLIDVLGISGCVPNYVCPATDETFKLRRGDNQLDFEAQINTSEDLDAFARACEDEAKAHYGAHRDKAGTCVSQPFHDNLVCGNAKVDFELTKAVAKRWHGGHDTCDRVRRFRDAKAPKGKACVRTCDEAGPLPQPPAPPAPRLREGVEVGKPKVPEKGLAELAAKASSSSDSKSEPAGEPDASAKEAPADATTTAAQRKAAQGEGGALGNVRWYLIGGLLLVLGVALGVLWARPRGGGGRS